MSLGAGAFKISGRPNAIRREEVSMATLEAGTTPRGATNRHRHTEWNSVEIFTYENTYLRKYSLTKPYSREGGEGARICNDLQEGKNWSCRSASKATMPHNTSKKAHKEPCNSPKAAP